MLEVKNVCKNYNEVKALDNVNLVVNKGDFISVTGKSGSGKSTLLYVLSLLESIDKGNIVFNGIDYKNLKEKDCAKLRNKSFGFVFQSFNLENSYSVFENVEIPLLINGISTKYIKNIVSEKLSLVNLTDKLDNKVATLSGGEKQRVALARAMVLNPEIIFADEPCGNLDNINSNNVMNILKELNTQGTTIILVTHNLADAKQAPRQYYMTDGKLIQIE